MGFGPRPPAAAAAAAAAAISAQASAASSMLSGDVVTICGFATLMDEASAREATPSLRHFRLGRVDGHCRVFNLASILNIRRGVARGDRFLKHPTFVICRDPVFAICQQFILFFRPDRLVHPPISPICRTPLFPYLPFEFFF